MQFLTPNNRVNLPDADDRERNTEISRQLVDACFDSIACATIDGRAIFVNRAGRELLGLDAELVTQTTISDYHSPEDLAYFHAEIMPVLEREDRWTGEFRFRHFQTGAPIAVEYHVFLIKDPQTGTATHIATVSRDSRDRQKILAEREVVTAALRESEQKFRAVFDRAFELMGLIGLNGKVLDLNQSALETLAAQPQEIIGRMFWDMPWWTYSPDIPRRLREAIVQAAEGNTIRYELPFYDAEGNVRTADFSLKPAVDDAGRAMLLIAEGRDMTEFKQNERRLQESEERLRIGTRVAGVAIASFNYLTNAVELSPEAADLYGIPRDEPTITRDRLHDTFHPDDRQWLEAAIARVLDPAGVGWFADDHRVVWPNGEIRWLSVRKQVFFDRMGEEPRPDYAILAAIDITERKQLEATIQSQLAQINTIYASAPIGLCFLDRQRRYIQLNERLAEINGLSIAAHLGRTVREILPELAEIQEPIFESVLTTGEAVLDIEVNGQTPAQPGIDRTWLVSYHPLQTANSEPIGINIMVQEITERKKSELALLQSEAKARQRSTEIEALYANAPIGLCYVDRDLRFVRINERLAEINGSSPAAHIGRTLRDMLPEQADALEPLYRQVLSTGAPILDFEFSGTNRAQPGIERYWLLGLYPHRDGTQIVGVNVVIQEITERKQAEAERERLLAAAEAANRSKDEFVAIVAHELRSPLNSIAGWARLLQGRSLDPATTDKALETIVRNTQVQVQLIEDLLDISRLIRGTLHLQLQRVDLAATIAAAIDLVLPQAQAKYLQLETQIAYHSYVNGDLHRLQQIVVNLLNNAIKFTPNGGRVTIELSEIADRACIRISDTGKGIAPEFLPQIFERFQQGQPNTGAKDGLGLGLAIVKNLVELHHGQITAHSPGIDRGATFTLYLPLVIAPRSDSIATNRDLEAIDLAGVRILVVDDEVDMTELVEFILTEAGATVQTANSVAAACDCWDEFQPHVLISDLAMPEANGYDLLARAHSLASGNIPAIALTAYSSLDAQERASQAGFQLYLTKPVPPAELVAAIVGVLGERD